MKFDLHFPSTEVMINSMCTEQMNRRPRESQISVGLYIPDLPQREKAFLAFEPLSFSFL